MGFVLLKLDQRPADGRNQLGRFSRFFWIICPETAALMPKPRLRHVVQRNASQGLASLCIGDG